MIGPDLLGRTADETNLPWWGRLRIMLPLVGILVTLTSTLAALTLQWQKQDVAAQRHHLALNQVRVLSDDLGSTLAGIDLLLLHLAEHFSVADLTRKGGNPHLEAYLQQEGARAPFLRTVFTVDEHGWSYDSSVPGRKHLDLSGSEYFLRHRDDPSSNLYVSRLTKLAISGKYTLFITRRLNHPDGRFAGLLGAGLNPIYLEHFHDAISSVEGARLNLLRTDGIVLARLPMQEDDIGKDLSRAPLFTTHIPQASQGSYDTYSPFDGVRRTVAYQVLPGHPLVVTVASAATDISDATLRQGAAYGTMVLIMAVALVALVLSLRQLALRRASEQELGRRKRELERFAEIMAHHIQEPVRLQSAYSQRLLRLLPPYQNDEIRTTLGFIQAGANRLRALVKDIQRYLAIDLIGDPQALSDPALVAEQVRTSYRDALIQAGGIMEVQAMPPLRMAPDRLALVLDALVDNAIAYRHPDRPLLIRVSAQPHGPRVLLSVTDNGLGIEPQFRDRVFMVFERLHGNNNLPGTGVGLALVRKIVESQGGKAWIEDGEDGGTAVRILLNGE